MNAFQIRWRTKGFSKPCMAGISKAAIGNQVPDKPSAPWFIGCSAAKSTILVALWMLLFAGVCQAADPEGKLLFDGKSLDGWKKTDFPGSGDVLVKDKQLILRFGETLTGVTYQRPLPKTNYEVSLEAQRVDGSDFFCGLTFPVGDEFCSLILGGWGGSVIGLSSLDGLDASMNPTTDYEHFENGRWYKIRLRVTDAKIEAWIGDKQYIDVQRKGVKFSVRIEVDESRPFGIASYQSTAAIRNFRLRSIAAKTEKTTQKGQ
ncbi:MAG: DUF1080 domain-containing protein [Pirellulales bacterium]|nr:DUF1080 domain-containing protein [Pirellulales bacterium]